MRKIRAWKNPHEDSDRLDDSGELFRPEEEETSDEVSCEEESRGHSRSHDHAGKRRRSKPPERSYSPESPVPKAQGNPRKRKEGLENPQEDSDPLDDSGESFRPKEEMTSYEDSCEEESRGRSRLRDHAGKRRRSKPPERNKAQGNPRKRKLYFEGEGSQVKKRDQENLGTPVAVKEKHKKKRGPTECPICHK